MKRQRNELYRLSLELAQGKVLQISEPMKLKKLQLDENGKKIGEYEEVVMTVREQYLPPVKEALQILWEMCGEEKTTGNTQVTHMIPRPNEQA